MREKPQRGLTRPPLQTAWPGRSASLSFGDWTDGDVFAFAVTRESSRRVRINVEQQRQKTAVISAESQTREQVREEPCIDPGFRISSAVPPTRTMFRSFAKAK